MSRSRPSIRIAATLIFLKSKALLPPIPAEFVDDAETPEEVEEHLRRRLIAYSKYREFGEQLREHQNEASSFYYRESGDPAGEMCSATISTRETQTRVHRDAGAGRPETLDARERVSMIASMDYIMRIIKERGDAHFSDLCAEWHDARRHRRHFSGDPRADSPSPRRLRANRCF